jgi:hypothetical protein
MAARESAQQTTDVDDKIAEAAVSLFGQVEDQINRTDTKAQVVLAADAILLGWFGTQRPNSIQALLAGHPSTEGWVTALLVALVFVGLFLSLLCGLLVIWPRVGGSPGSSLVYYGSIADRSDPDFVAAFLRQSRTEVTQSVLAGVHAKARIAQQNFRWVSLSVVFLVGTLVLWTALQIMRLALP